MKKTLLACFAVLVLAVPARAQLSEKYATWPEGPVQYLLTEDEAARYATLTTDEAAQEFIDLFWAKRDPDLNTRVNEFKVDFDARVAAADEQFAEKDGTRGALTERGKVLILMGKPARRWTQSIQEYLSRLYGETAVGAAAPTSARAAQSQMHGVSFNPAKGLADVWVYSREQIPEGCKIPKRVDNVMFAFLDTEGTTHYILDRSYPDSRWGIKVLAQMPEIYLKHPELTELPVFPLIPGTQAATPEQLEWLALDPAPWPDGAQAGAVQGVVTEHIFAAWVAVILPPGAPAADLAVGRLTDGSGKVVGTFQKPVTGLETTRGLLYELMVPSPAGTSTFEVALAGGGSPVAVKTLELQMEDVAPDATWFSPMVTGAQIFQMTDFEAGTPFVFGGYHLVPRLDGTYTRQEPLDYFCLLVRPGVGEDGKPAVKLKLKLFLDDKEISRQPYREAEISPVEPNVFMFGSQLPLNILPKPGNYALEVTLWDTVNDVKRTTRIPVVIVE